MIIEEYRDKFLQIINEVLEKNGNNFEDMEFILDSALDLALNDKRGEFYR